MFERILVATDGSLHGNKAAREAINLGKLSLGKVLAIYVADTNRTSHLPDDMLLFSIRELLIKEGKETGKEVEKLGEEAGVKVEFQIKEGNPSNEILDFAVKSKADIIVIGAVGRTGLDKFLLGSVAEKVVRNSKIPVLLIPKEES
jgi:nucleotide-binding universal stress UspA family protein